MDKNEPTRTCGTCHRDVAESNFALHETHCSRFLCLCPDCEETVPREQLDQHREEQHTMVRCSKCNQKMERRHLMDHETDECVKRLQSCRFCELELPWEELDEHHVVCGSRTERCRDCGLYVTLRDQPEHGSTCSGADDGSGPPQTTGRPSPKTGISTMEEHEYTSEETSDDEEDEEEDETNFRWGPTSGPGTLTAASLSDKPGGGAWADGGDPYRISTCPHCHLALPLVTLRWHKEKCRIHVLLK